MEPLLRLADGPLGLLLGLQLLATTLLLLVVVYALFVRHGRTVFQALSEPASKDREEDRQALHRAEILEQVNRSLQQTNERLQRQLAEFEAVREEIGKLSELQQENTRLKEALAFLPPPALAPDPLQRSRDAPISR